MIAAAPASWDRDPATSRRLLWIKANRQPDESLYQAGRRYLEMIGEAASHEHRHTVRRILRGPIKPESACLVDDGEDDVLWMLDHGLRRYRIRPWRAEDGEPTGYTFPCITVIDLETGVGVYGLPQSVLRHVGVPVEPVDSDTFGNLFFEVRTASRNFNRKAPAGLFG